ncbi:Uncharacterized protein HZ326_12821 [Fusarium oxysporum f. sp. albedinis]|nr:Uncharacterized protein HZ326_12821 [Fusarium oxysporum f. sp. albedinis]
MLIPIDRVPGLHQATPCGRHVWLGPVLANQEAPSSTSGLERHLNTKHPAINITSISVRRIANLAPLKTISLSANP